MVNIEAAPVVVTIIIPGIIPGLRRCRGAGLAGGFCAVGLRGRCAGDVIVFFECAIEHQLLQTPVGKERGKERGGTRDGD